MLSTARTQETEVASLDRRYLVGRVIAARDSIVVREGIHIHTGQRVVVKLVHPELVGDSRARQRLLREAAFLGSVRHANVVGVVDAGVCEEWGAYMVMESLVGRPLDGWLTSRTRLEPAQAMPILRGLVDALSAIHARHIIHRDIKPANVVLVGGDEPRPVLIDFECALEIDTVNAGTFQDRGATGSGSLEYVAPELLAGHRADARSDLYAFGVVAFEMLTGALPFAEGEVLLPNAGSNEAQRRVLEQWGVPGSLAAVVLGCIAVDPDARYRSASQVGAALEAAGNDPVAPTQVATLRPDAASRRSHTRVPYVTPMRVLTIGGVDVDGRSEDIAAGGLLFVCQQEMAIGDVAMVRIPLPMSGRMETLPATVRWVKPGRLRYAVGLEFDGLTPRAKEEIVRYVALCVARDEAGGAG